MEATKQRTAAYEAPPDQNAFSPQQGQLKSAQAILTSSTPIISPISGGASVNICLFSLPLLPCVTSERWMRMRRALLFPSSPRRERDSPAAATSLSKCGLVRRATLPPNAPVCEGVWGKSADGVWRMRALLRTSQILLRRDVTFDPHRALPSGGEVTPHFWFSHTFHHKFVEERAGKDAETL